MRPSKHRSFIKSNGFYNFYHRRVQISYVDKQGLHSTRDIEAYSLRRSKAGDVLLMAVRADNGQARSYLVKKIIGVKPTQKSFIPRYPIELTLSGLQNNLLPRNTHR